MNTVLYHLYVETKIRHEPVYETESQIENRLWLPGVEGLGEGWHVQLI